MGWLAYDWASSAFATTVMAGFFPIFFKQYWNDGVDVTISTFRLGTANSIASLTVAMMAPVFGAIADAGGRRRQFLLSFATIGIALTAALFFIAQGAWLVAAVIYVIAILGFSGSNVFYDALLVTVAPPAKSDSDLCPGIRGWISWGWSPLCNKCCHDSLPRRIRHGRRGGGGARIVPHRRRMVGRLLDPARAVRSRGPGCENPNLVGGRRILTAFRHVSPAATTQDGVLFPHRLLALYRRGSHDRPHGRRLRTLARLHVQRPDRRAPHRAIRGISGDDCVWGASRAAWEHAVRSSSASPSTWASRCGVVRMSSIGEFYALAICIGLVQGGVTSLSRSYFSRLIPREKSGQFFGFYNTVGRFSAVLGPILMGWVSVATGNPRYSMFRRARLVRRRRSVVASRARRCKMSGAVCLSCDMMPSRAGLSGALSLETRALKWQNCAN